MKAAHFAWISIATALVTITLKGTAYLLTGSVGLFSDALESGVNLVAALLVLVALTVAASPPDEEHAYGHYKAEYFSSGVEGTLIIVAAVLIIVSAIQRLRAPVALEQLDVGFALTVVSTVLNFLVAQLLARAAKRFRSVALEADAQHLMTDVWTSGGVLIGVGLLWVTGWYWIDGVIALGVALHIMLVGWRLVNKSLHGLMDTALPPAELSRLDLILEAYCQQDVSFHAVRTRLSGSVRFVSLHMQVPGDWSIQRGHVLMERLEADIRAQLSPVSIIIHIEPVEQPIFHHSQSAEPIFFIWLKD